MRSLAFSNVVLTPDLEVKQTAAKKQMDELMALLKVTPKYHTLTKGDRQQLKKKGYAPDLVDNLIVMTQNQGTPTSRNEDNIVIGFTYAAFDPALYANSTITAHYETLSMGCCCYCESFLMPTDSGVISHYRPVQLLDIEEANRANSKQQCSPYFSLAYQQENLMYSCRACDEKYKAGLFPVKEQRYPEQTIEQEQPLLINPYHEQPRDFIRFNPNNGQAYAYDHVCDFYRATKQLSVSEVEALLWRQPSAIPNQKNHQGQSLTEQDVDDSYHAWLRQQSITSQSIGNQTAFAQTKGQITIATLGLNRTALVLSRLALLKQLRHDNGWINKPPQSTDELSLNAYRSLAVDAFSTWHAQQTVQKVVSKSVPKAVSKVMEKVMVPVNQDESVTLETMAKPEQSVALDNAVTPEETGIPPENSRFQNEKMESINRPAFPVWLRSCLTYFVSESELHQTNKRRLVYLSGKDRLYGEKPKEKCLFLPINWQQDSNNIIKVRSHRNTWEASFLELASSRPQELVELFANNDIWVEGTYPALTI